MHRIRFRVIDVLVLLVVIGFIVAGIVSSLPTMREAARKWQCANNLKQIGLALHHYHEMHRVLPPAAVQPNFQARWVLYAPKAKYGESAVVSHANWVMLLLPHLGKQDLAAMFNTTLPISDPANAKGRMAELPLMKCPADTYNRPDNRYLCVLNDQTKITYARGNYAINAGSSPIYDYPGTTSDPEPMGIVRVREGNVERWWGDGVAGFDKSFSFDEFDNGLSTVVAVDEIRAGIAPCDSRGVWALGQIGPSVTHAHGLYGDDDRPNCTWWRGDDILGAAQLYATLGRAKIEEERMGCFPDSYLPLQSTARSMHPGGVHVLMMDGSSHFVIDEVDPDIWHVIHSRKAEGQIPLDQLTVKSEKEVTYTTTSVNATFVNNSPPEGPTPTKESQGSPEVVVNSIGMKLIKIPPGQFIMGLSDKDGGAVLEAPAHWVRITKAFHIGVYEVTQEQYQQIMGRNPSWHSSSGGGKAQVAGKETAKFPVEQVSWNDALEFCRRLSALPAERTVGRAYRLPTEAEWEYVCRSGSTAQHVYKRFGPPDLETGENGGGYDTKPREHSLPITPVGTYKPNAFGVYDMRGNVWEWTADYYERSYYKRSPLDDPQGPASGVLRVARGIDWIFTGQPCRLNLHTFEPSVTSRFIGFRVVCEKKL